MALIAAVLAGMAMSYLCWRTVADGLATVAVEVRDMDLPVAEAIVACLGLVVSVAIAGAATWMLTAIWLPRVAQALMGPGGALGAAAGLGVWMVQYVLLRPQPWPVVTDVTLALAAAAGSGSARHRVPGPRHTAGGGSAEQPARVTR